MQKRGAGQIESRRASQGLILGLAAASSAGFSQQFSMRRTHGGAPQIYS